MSIVVSLLLASLGPAPAAVAEGVEAAPIEGFGDAASTDAEGSAPASQPSETRPLSGSPAPRARRVQPRVSSTRCSFVTCAPECRIKGSRNARGELVYSRPGNPGYDQSSPDAVFCSAEAARAAGYKEAGRS